MRPLRPRLFSAAVLSLSLIFSACGGGGSDGGTTDPGGGIGAVAVVVLPTSVSLSLGASSVVGVQVGRTGTFTGTVNLAVSGVPAGVTATFAPATLSSTLTASALTVTVGSGASSGTSTITVSASGSGVTTATATFQLTIAAGTFTVAATPASLSISAGGSNVSTLTITRGNGFASAINFSVTSPPTGITAAFSPASTTGNSASVTITVASTVAAGSYTVNVLAQGAGASDKTVAIPVTVTAAQPTGFTLAMDPVEFDLPAGQGWTGNGIATITRQSGFTGAVTISVSAFTGLTAAIASPSPSTITAGNTATNIIALTLDGAAPGVYNATVKASAAGFADQIVPVRVRVSAPSTGAIQWKFCSASRVPKYFAVRDGSTGAWQHIVPQGPAAATAASPTTFNFSLSQSVGAVAMINLGEKTSQSNLIEGHDWQVYYMTTAEITDVASRECTRYPDVGTRTSSVSVTGYSSFDLVLGNIGASNFQYSNSTSLATTTFSFTNMQPGAFDMLLSKSAFVSGNFQTMLAFNLQRGLNPSNGAALAAVNLSTAGTVPTASTVTVGNSNNETFFSTQTFMTATGLNALMGTTGAFSTLTRSWWGVPQAQTIAGDLHQMIITTATGAPRRAVISYARTPSTRNIDFGPALTAPTVTAGANGAPAWIVRATGTLSTDYTSRASMYLREQFADPRTMTIYATRGYLGAGSSYDFAVPDLSAASGFTFFWNFHRNTNVAYTVTGGDGDPGGPMESTCMLTGVCFVKAVDGAVYKSAQAVGTVGVP